MLDEAAAGRQPFDGEFYAELRHPVLKPDGLAELIGRTDIEWRLFGFPAFVIEFKILGRNRRTPVYLNEGVVRFVDGRYARGAAAGAMCALVRPSLAGVNPVAELEALIDSAPAALRCVPDSLKALRHSPSALAPVSARFDTVHERDAPRQPVRLAHIFLDIPAPSDT